MQRLFGLAVPLPDTRAYKLTLLGIILLGLILRLHNWYTGQAFTYYAMNDEIAALQMALRFLDGDPVAWYLGQPAFSSGQLPGPLWTLFCVAVYKLGGSNIYGATLFIALLNTYVIYLVYRLARRLLGTDYALLAAFLYATSPWTVYYSSGLWNPLPLALLSVLLFLTLWQCTQKDRSSAIFWVAVLTAALPQFHMIGVFYAPTILLILILSPQRWHRGWFAAGVVIGIALYLPYLIGDMQQHWANTHAMLKDDGRSSWGVMKILVVPINLLSNLTSGWPGYEFKDYLQFGDRTFGSRYILLAINLVSLALAAIMLGHFVSAGWKQISKQPRLCMHSAYASAPSLVFMFLLLVVPLLTFLITRHTYSSRYSIIIFPILLLVPVWFLQSLRSERMRRLVTGLLAFMTVVNIYLVVIFYFDQHQRIEQASYLQPSFRKLEQIRTALQQHAGTANIRVDNNEYRDRYTDSYSYIVAVTLKDYIETIGRNPSDHSELVIYRLAAEGTADVHSNAIGYRAHGIVLYKIQP